ncbi:MAG TPA: alpha/beta hydrolase [Lacibacter sp.]|nr:alpha/beta hydrolase [Lacibacter sp.]
MNYSVHKEVNIAVGKLSVQGYLAIPEQAKAIVVFSHGSGISRLSKRNRRVAAYLQDKKLGTLLFDLLTPEEDRFYENRFNIDLLTKRLITVTEWLQDQKATKLFPIGYFGAGTGTAVAIKAALTLPHIYGIVSRGGRPDLVLEDLYRLECPTLLITGSVDADVLQLNLKAFDKLNCEKKLEVINGTNNFFEENGAIEKVEELAMNWFRKYTPQMTLL